MNKALVVDTLPLFEREKRDIFAGQLELKMAESKDPQYLAEAVADCDAILVALSKIPANVIEAGKKLRVIARYGIGTDNIDIAQATAQGIVVTYCPEYHLPTAPEHVLALMFALARKICLGDLSVRQGNWDHTVAMGVDIEGKTLGILGLGRIGTKLAQKAAALGMNVIGYDPLVKAEQLNGLDIDVVDFDTVVKSADFLSICMPLTDQTQGLINASVFARMKDSAFLINNARGPIVDENDLYDALKGNVIAGAALDVMTQEPPGPGHKLYELDNVIITPHCTGSTVESMQRVEMTAAQSAVDVLAGKKPKYIRNPEVLDKLDLQ
ncbi:MAG: hydroxyacid dehydrogenase [Sedimentisphaerales bacterium]|nr:hydroxyacid dehydrogenase [Sedimentisphaerales bacterium]